MYTVLYYILYRHYQHQHQHPPSFSPHQSFSSFLATAPHHNHFQSSYLPFWGKLFYGITQRYPLVQKTIENGPVEMVEIHPSKNGCALRALDGAPGSSARAPHWRRSSAPAAARARAETASRRACGAAVPLLARSQNLVLWRCGSHNRSRRN